MHRNVDGNIVTLIPNEGMIILQKNTGMTYTVVKCSLEKESNYIEIDNPGAAL